jgi:hypothetical protein
VFSTIRQPQDCQPSPFPRRWQALGALRVGCNDRLRSPPGHHRRLRFHRGSRWVRSAGRSKRPSPGGTFLVAGDGQGRLARGTSPPHACRRRAWRQPSDILHPYDAAWGPSDCPETETSERTGSGLTRGLGDQRRRRGLPPAVRSTGVPVYRTPPSHKGCAGCEAVTRVPPRDRA